MAAARIATDVAFDITPVEQSGGCACSCRVSDSGHAVAHRRQLGSVPEIFICGVPQVVFQTPKPRGTCADGRVAFSFHPAGSNPLPT